MTQWTNHFSSIATSQSHSNSAVVEVYKKIPNLTSLSKLNSDDIVDDDFTVEVELALKKLKTRKAGGLDGLQPEHLKYGGALLTLWLKQIFNAFIRLEHIPPHILTGIIRPVYKGKGKDPFNCHSFRGIARTSVILKSFESLLLERIRPILQANGHPLLIQTAYQKHNSCQDAIFSTQESILKIVREGGDAFLSLFDLEKAYSLEHAVLLDSLFEAGIKGRAWRIISCIYNNLQAVVSSGQSLSEPFHVSRGMQQGSVLSPTFFLVVMDRLLTELKQNKAGISICNLYLGGAANADDVRAIASSTQGTEDGRPRQNDCQYCHQKRPLPQQVEDRDSAVLQKTFPTYLCHQLHEFHCSYHFRSQVLGISLAQIPLHQAGCRAEHC